MFAGVMMTAITEGMDGYAGLKGWQWVFLIDGIITLPIAIMGFLYFPDTPEVTKAPFLSEEEVALSLERLPPKKKDGHNINAWSLINRVFKSPSFYILVLFSAICGALEAWTVQGCYLLWLKYHKENYTASEITTYPLGKRVPMGLLAAGLQILSSILLLVPNLPTGGIMFAFYNAGTAYIINPLLFGWANVICQRGGDDALRSIILYSRNAASSILYTFWGIVLYPATEMPYWKKGAIAMIVVAVVMIAMLWVVLWLDRFTLRKEEEVLTGVPHQSESVENGDLDRKDSEVKTDEKVVS